MEVDTRASEGVTTSEAQRTRGKELQALLGSTDYVSVLAGLMARHLQALGLRRVVAMRTPQAFGRIGVLWEAADASPLVEQFIEVLRVQARELSGLRA